MDYIFHINNLRLDFVTDMISQDQGSAPGRESAKNGRIGAHGLNCIFFSILSSYSKSWIKIT